jgi:predicted phosphodiesterase
MTPFRITLETKQFCTLLLVTGALAQGQLLSPAWVEVGEGGRAVARVVTQSEDCPTIQIDGVSQAMLPRRPVPDGFRPACERAIPATAKSARVGGQDLALPHPDPSRIVAFGDTGCRIQGARIQNCSDPAEWPFERIAGAAAAERPDLVLHAGDYVYRDEACPAAKQSQCAGSPFGDNWDAWNADFFKPAAKLLAAAPWVFVRGNRESCDRFWKGWFYYLDSRPFHDTCEVTPPPYVVQLGKFQLVAFDTAAVVETQMIPELSSAYAAQLTGLHVTNAWLLDHHPFWAVRPEVPLPGAQPVILQEAWDKANPQGIDLIVSGHTHISQMLSFASGRPAQVVAGTGGTQLADPIPERVDGTVIRGVAVTASQIELEFGFASFTKAGSGWTLAVRNPQGGTVATGRIDGRHLTPAR